MKCSRFIADFWSIMSFPPNLSGTSLVFDLRQLSEVRQSLKVRTTISAWRFNHKWLATTHEIALQAQVQRDRFDFARKSYRHWTEIRFPGVAGPARDEPIAVAVLARRRHRRSYQRRLKGFISRLRWRCAPLRLNATYLPTFCQNTIQELHRQCFSNRWLADSR